MAAVALKGRRITVAGVNASAVALAKFLLRRGSQVVLIDTAARDKIEALYAEQIDLARVQLECGEIQLAALQGSELVVVTPGFTADSRFLDLVRTAGVTLISELEFVSQFVQEPILAIAGTNGKSTTAYLVEKIFEADGKLFFSNAQQPLANYLVANKEFVGLAAAATPAQLECVQTLKPKTIALLNISEDGLNRYTSFDAYVAVQKEILKNADANTTLILNSQDAALAGWAPQLAAQTYMFSNMPLPEGLEGAWYTKNELFVRIKSEAEPIKFNLSNFRLRGSHNRENLCVAALFALLNKVKAASVQKAIDSVVALPNRVEFVRRINSVAFYNDAACANPQAVIRTLQAFQEPVILISGGRDKNADYAPLIPHIRQRVKNLILIGEAKEKVNRAIGDFTETFLVGTVEEALILAYQKSRSGDVILLSPGCDHSDIFASMDARGDLFRKLVNQISQPRRPNVI
jgi:UDP-N-acetylmuramoylalanine--D-glutamate ligase